MNREDERQFLRHLAQRRGDAREHDRVIDVRRSMKCHDAIARMSLLEGQRSTRCRRRTQQRVTLIEHVVDHHMTDVVHRLRTLALAQQVLLAAGLGDEEPVGDRIGHEAVDLLGHRHVATAQPGLDVSHRNAELLRDDGAGERRVHVADDDHRSGAIGLAQFFERHHHFRGLLRVGAAASAEMMIGFRNTQFLEEHIAHLAVVVLARVHDAIGERVLAAIERAHHRRELHEVRPRTGHEVEHLCSHASAHRLELCRHDRQFVDQCFGLADISPA